MEKGLDKKSAKNVMQEPSIIKFTLEAKVNGVIVYYIIADTTAEIAGNLGMAEDAVEVTLNEQ
jgi:alkyl hydroperoxide reductase subunit AhpC